MSRDPIRLVDLNDPPSPKAEFMRDIIRAQQTVRPPEGKMEELARRLGPVLQQSPPPAPSTPWLGLAAAAAVVATVALVGVTLSTKDPVKTEPPVRASASAQADERAPTPLRAPEPDLDPPSSATVPVDALPSAEIRKSPAPSSAASRCDDVMLVDAADTELRAGKPEAALAVVREHERRCPTGALVQERERIAIEALVQLGRIDQARGRARAFEQRFPSSPHVGRIRQALDRHPR